MSGNIWQLVILYKSSKFMRLDKSEASMKFVLDLLYGGGPLPSLANVVERMSSQIYLNVITSEHVYRLSMSCFSRSCSTFQVVLEYI